MLHYALSEGAGIDVVWYLVSRMPLLVAEWDSYRALPLHLASMYDPNLSNDVLRHLLRLTPTFVRVQIIDLDASPHKIMPGILGCWTNADHNRFSMICVLFVGSPANSSLLASVPFMNNRQPVDTLRLGARRVISHRASNSASLPPPP